MLKGKILSAALLVGLLSGCATPEAINLTANFNSQEAEALIKPGVNILSGSALIRQNGGGVVTCAGLPIMLIPKTAYATQRVMAIYGNSQRGYSPVDHQVKFTPDLPEYLQLSRQAVCDAQGHFEFGDVADGNFFVISTILWQAANSAQGGGLMQAVSVRGGENKQLVLSP